MQLLTASVPVGCDLSAGGLQLHDSRLKKLFSVAVGAVCAGTHICLASQKRI